VHEGEDNMLHAFILSEIQKGEKSQYYHMIRMWPKDTDILMNWDEEDLEWLQDATLMREAGKNYDDFLDSWKRLYDCLVKYPDYFKPESISLYRFKWVYILTTNRCFSSNWPGVCQMVPFADQINHENVDVNYDCLDPKTGISLTSEAEKEEKRRQEAQALHNKQKEFLVTLKDDLTGITDMIQQERDGHANAPNESNTWRISTKP
jgi:hypothetical protein